MYFSCLRGHFFSWTGQSALARAARVRLGLGEGAKILEQGTVSASIVDLAYFWGCRKICLVGQDMAFATTGQTHVKDSFYADEGRCLLDTLKQSLWVAANTGGEVPTDSRLFTYLKTFENLVRDYQDIEFINIAPRGGCYYWSSLQGSRGCTGVALGSGSTEMVRSELKALIDGYHSPALDAMNKCLNASKDFANRVFQASFEAALYCELMSERMREKSYDHHAFFRILDQQATALNRLLDRYPRDYEVLFEGRTRTELAQYQAKLDTLNQDTSAWGRSRANKEFFLGYCRRGSLSVRDP